MKSRNRARAILNKRTPDRIAIDLGGTEQTSISIETYKKLREFYGLKSDGVKVWNLTQQLAVIDNDILKIIDADFKPLTIKPPDNWKPQIKEEEKNGRDYLYYIDEWGTKLTMPKFKGYYYDFGDMPLEGLDLNEIKKHKFPDPENPGRYKGIKDEAKDIYENTDYSIVGSPIFGGGIFEQPARIRGMENFLIDTVSNIEIAEYLYSVVTEIYIESTKRFLNEVKDYIDVIAYWDDITHQSGYIISKEHYKKYLKPKHKKYFECIKKYSNAKIYFHCCGAVNDFIPDLIDVGVDILNPIQVSAKNMHDTKKLKREYGKDLIFWGGAVNTQSTLPFGTKKQVGEEVKRNISNLGENGGYVLANIHNIQTGVPVENIVTMFETALKYGRY